MQIPTRTPEGDSNRCPVCGNVVQIERSMDSRDAPCPHCGHLLWFDQPFMQVKLDGTDGFTEVRFVCKELRDEMGIRLIGGDLFRLVDELGCRNIRLDFSKVATLSSAALGALITMNRKVQAVRGKLVLRGLSSEIKEVFAITRLDKLFDIEEE